MTLLVKENPILHDIFGERKSSLLGRGVNREGFNFKLAMVKMCSTWPLLKKYAIWKNFEVGLQTPPSPQTPYIVYEKGKNWKFEFYSCSNQNVFQLT